MNVFFDDITALEQWRYDDLYADTLRHHAYAVNLQDTPATKRELLAALPVSKPDADNPICLLTANKDNRPRAAGYRISAITSALPEDSFRQIEPGVYRASPELCFARLASKLSLAQLIEVGMELCGAYSLRLQTKKGYEQRESQLTSTFLLRRYIENMPEFAGSKNARRALKYMRDGSESPMETRQYLLLCLPPRMGGYGLTGATVNGELKLNARAAALARRKSFRCDLYWISKGVVVEYDSKEHHLGLAAFMRDNAKRNILTDMGIKVFVVSSAQILDVDQFDVIAHMVAKAIGKRLRSFPADWEDRRAQLRRELFASMGHSQHC